MRAMSIAFVMLNHIGLDGFLQQGSFARNRLWHLFSGETGVHIFFVLSGFLITSILLLEKQRTGTIRFGNFFARRFLRLLPPLILFFIAVAVLMGTGIVNADLQAFLMSFFYLYNYAPLQHYINELAHTWSLGVEEQFYLVWPLCLSYLKEYRAILIFSGAFILVSLAALLTFPEYVFHAHLRPKRWFIPAAGHILVGCSFAVVNAARSDYAEMFRKAGMFAVAVIFYLAPVYVPAYFIESSALIQSVGIGFLLLWIFHNQEHGFVRFMDLGIFAYFGRISYGLYVFQGLFLTTGYGSEHFFQQYPQNVLFSFAAAIFSYHLVEKHVLKLKVHFKS